MLLDRHPINITSNNKRSAKVIPLKGIKEYKYKYNYLYIGNDLNSQNYLSLQFHNGIHSSSLEKALEYLSNIKKFRLDLPDIIFFDIELNKGQFTSFNSFLINQSELSEIPLLFIENQLSASDIFYLKNNKLIDDMVNIFNHEINYKNKISFIKKVKESGRISKNEALNSFSNFQKLNTNVHLFKRVFDIIVACLFIAVLSPLFILIALAIKIDSRGPVIYKSFRAGQGFKVFKFFKFRTMEVDAETQINKLNHLNNYGECEIGAKFLKITNDPRVTRIGKILRKISMDELPQLFNVLRGDMSIVGNRPLPLYEAATLTTDVFVERFVGPAGITGLWQVKKKSNPHMSVEERINLDINYSRRCSFLYDMNIILRTPAALFQKNNS